MDGDLGRHKSNLGAGHYHSRVRGCAESGAKPRERGHWNGNVDRRAGKDKNGGSGSSADDRANWLRGVAVAAGVVGLVV